MIDLHCNPASLLNDRYLHEVHSPLLGLRHNSTDVLRCGDQDVLVIYYLVVEAVRIIERVLCVQQVRHLAF